VTEVGGLAAVDAALAQHAPLPRDNGELVFEEPWQGRALGMGVLVLERTGASWAQFRRHLVAAIERRPPRADETAATAYYAAWLDALERLLRGPAEEQPVGDREQHRERAGEECDGVQVPEGERVERDQQGRREAGNG
jgi:nitrile hydratase accessory protein